MRRAVLRAEPPTPEPSHQGLDRQAEDRDGCNPHRNLRVGQPRDECVIIEEEACLHAAGAAVEHGSDGTVGSNGRCSDCGEAEAGRRCTH